MFRAMVSLTAPSAHDLRLTGREWAFMVFLYAAIAAVTVLGFFLAFTFLPHSSNQDVVGSTLIFTGLALTAYILGLRHGFDADHIAAIDNTTRKLLNENKRPLTVGTWFSLGHSTIVVIMVAAFIAATELVKSTYPQLLAGGAIVGTLVSGVFLIIIGLVNLVIFSDVHRVFRGLRDGSVDPAALEDEMQKRGFLYRYFGRLFRVVNEPWQIYPIGVLFGLGFDTATEIIIIAIAVTFAATAGISLWFIMILPLLFTCGMVLSDTTDGFAMRYAYGWAFLKPLRKVYYNLTLTLLSVLVAMLIGGVEFLQVLSTELGWGGGFWAWLNGLDFETLGIGIVGLFIGSWVIAMLVYRLKGYEESGFGQVPLTGDVGKDL